MTIPAPFGIEPTILVMVGTLIFKVKINYYRLLL